ncbi:glycogen debranching protein GlgX [Elioraea sp.]|uniref:glycogen debranching protein GlgX n=1 Tax=Elioraea sp. TaxID=2185103 RepID=UPI0025BC1309|nr:glycogen debranching protein GlgX [Elioraea sp.]
MTTLPDRLDPGAPWPLGATWDGMGVNVAVFSEHATRVVLCLFDADGRREAARLDLPECTDGVWHGYLAGAMPGLLYGFRVHGPYDPRAGHRFNPHKLLLDPYARALAGTLRHGDALYGHRLAAGGDHAQDRRDSAALMPKAVVTAFPEPDAEPRRPNTPWRDTVIYEAHLRGLTIANPDIPAARRGTFAALGHPAVIAHLHRIGITAIELLPIHAFVDEPFLMRKGLVNYWGYNSLAFFAPHQRYLATGAVEEVRQAVRALHEAGIEVILDVVYNHTAEGSEEGPTLSFRGIDNASYYRLHAEDRRRSINDTGTGNTLNVSHPRVIQLVMDSLRHWVSVYGIDGFRFDLSTVLGREAHGFDQGAGFFDALRQDPVLARTKLIAEPWDIGPGGYQLGNHPPGFAEWNDLFRDTVRRFWRGDEGMRPAMAARLAGSAGLFDKAGRRAWASVNYIASHDGFTLRDIVTYAHRHNAANGEDGRDGHSENHSANWGAEGESDDAAIVMTRSAVARAMLATVFVAHGTPMLAMGDEAWRTQGGNNNAYCQDNATSWLAWPESSGEAAAMTRFAARLAALRKSYPVLRTDRFLHGTPVAPGLPDIAWFEADGTALAPSRWHDHGARAFAMQLAGPANRGGADQGGIEIVRVLMNPGSEPATFRHPSAFRAVLDSAAPDCEAAAPADSTDVAPHALVVAVRRQALP